MVHIGDSVVASVSDRCEPAKAIEGVILLFVALTCNLLGCLGDCFIPNFMSPSDVLLANFTLR